MKFHENRKELFQKTIRISLVSSFIASVFCGKFAPIDVSDASGMNLLDLSTKQCKKLLLCLCVILFF
jgi:xylulokinase